MAALLFTGISSYQTHGQLEIARQAQIADRFTKAVSQLDDKSIDVRLGGLYALQRIMNDSTEDQPAVVNVLSAYIRTHSDRPAKPSAKNEDSPAEEDILATVKILGDRSPEHDGAGEVDLSDTNLRGAYLLEADLRHADLGGADLRGAGLKGAYLGMADLDGADLRGAYLGGAHLRYADLKGADVRTYLDGADLRYADLRGADLRGADLGGADLRANLEGADLRGANLYGAHLRGALLKGAKGDLDGARRSYRPPRTPHS